MRCANPTPRYHEHGFGLWRPIQAELAEGEIATGVDHGEAVEGSAEAPVDDLEQLPDQWGRINRSESLIWWIRRSIVI